MLYRPFKWKEEAQGGTDEANVIESIWFYAFAFVSNAILQVCPLKEKDPLVARLQLERC